MSVTFSGSSRAYEQKELVDIILGLEAGEKNVEDILRWIISHQKE